MCFHNFSKLRAKKMFFGSGNAFSVKSNKSRKSKKKIKNVKFTKKAMKKLSLLEIKNISKNDSIWKYSNPITSQNKSNHYLGKKRGKLYRSTNKNKKYMIYDDIQHKFVSFGQMKYEDFTKHKSRKRRKNYLTRSAKIRGDWRKNPFSANNLSRIILW